MRPTFLLVGSGRVESCLEKRVLGRGMASRLGLHGQ
jgi:hypothetical protein